MSYEGSDWGRERPELAAYVTALEAKLASFTDEDVERVAEAIDPYVDPAVDPLNVARAALSAYLET